MLEEFEIVKSKFDNFYNHFEILDDLNLEICKYYFIIFILFIFKIINNILKIELKFYYL